jgi:hypothetical protein
MCAFGAGLSPPDKSPADCPPSRATGPSAAELGTEGGAPRRCLPLNWVFVGRTPILRHSRDGACFQQLVFPAALRVEEITNVE